MDKAQAMRFDACLPESRWEFSLEKAVHVYNRTPMVRLKWRTPFEILTGAKPDISHLRVFGCGAYVHLPEEKRQNKLSPKSELMIFLGFPAGVKAFRFMRLHNNSLFIGTTAVFDETIFPKCPDMKRRGVTEIGQDPDNSQKDPSEQNDPQIPPLEAGDDDNFFPSNHFD